MKDFNTLLTLARDNDPKAQLYLAYCYYSGDGTEKNIAEAARWWTRLATLLDNDEYTDEEYDEILSGAHLYIEIARYELGCLYYNGIGVERDYLEAARWFKRSDSPHASYELAKCYYYGHGVAQNLDKALEHLERAAKEGHPDAIDHLELWHKEE